MKLPRLEELNSQRFLDEAFDVGHHDKWQSDARVRRNVYLWLFITGFICIFITAFTDQMTLCILSLFLSTISLVVMTKYDTQLFFLRILRVREEQKGDGSKKGPEPESSDP
ncbi:MAG: hypothetical protein U9P12_07680 [Verrucomicrobiota bacterium]|nr:hypothetical protein [Verrucomicrobiota bacterium]